MAEGAAADVADVVVEAVAATGAATRARAARAGAADDPRDMAKASLHAITLAKGRGVCAAVSTPVHRTGAGRRIGPSQQPRSTPPRRHSGGQGAYGPRAVAPLLTWKFRELPGSSRNFGFGGGERTRLKPGYRSFSVELAGTFGFVKEDDRRFSVKIPGNSGYRSFFVFEKGWCGASRRIEINGRNHWFISHWSLVTGHRPPVQLPPCS